MCRPRDIAGQEVELGVPYWGRSSSGLVHFGKFVDRNADIEFRAGSVIAGSRQWTQWKFLRAVVPSFEPVAPPAGTVRVRIAVAVDANGEWFARGGDSGGEEICVRDVSEVMGHKSLVSFVEADVPLPQPTTVEGTVSQ